MTKAIWFDMDGTIADLYGVTDWLPQLQSENANPYRVAKPMVNMNTLARYLNKLQKCGWSLGIISWGSKYSTDTYLHKVSETKIKWLKAHLASVKFNRINIVHYGTPKSSVCDGGILFDDEAQNREEWREQAYEPNQIFNVLKLLTSGKSCGIIKM